MFKKIIFTGLLLASAINAHAANSAPFGVTGTITPATCGVTLTGGVVNLGLISTVLVRSYSLAGGHYVVPLVGVPFNITCSAATKVQVSFVDNLLGKSTAAWTPAVKFGMVDGAGTTAIGAYEVFFSTMLIDGVAVGQYLNAANNTTVWGTSGIGGASPAYVAPSYTTGFAKVAGATTPDSLTTLSGTLNFQSLLLKTYVDSATNAITPNGSGTISLVYL